MAAERSSKQHILAINNNDDVLALFRELLEEEGYRVSTQPYALRDLADVARLAPDAIILDYMWAEEDGGWSMLQMLRMSRQTNHIPIVLCTGAVRKVEEMEGHLTEMGVRVVLKPFDIDRLLNVLAEALAQPARLIRIPGDHCGVGVARGWSLGLTPRSPSGVEHDR